MAECLSSASTFREEREGQGLFRKIAGKHLALSSIVCSQSKHKKNGFWLVDGNRERACLKEQANVHLW